MTRTCLKWPVAPTRPSFFISSGEFSLFSTKSLTLKIKEIQIPRDCCCYKNAWLSLIVRDVYTPSILYTHHLELRVEWHQKRYPLGRASSSNGQLQRREGMRRRMPHASQSRADLTITGKMSNRSPPYFPPCEWGPGDSLDRPSVRSFARFVCF